MRILHKDIFIVFWYFSCIMPQVLQELIDSPLSTILVSKFYILTRVFVIFGKIIIFVNVIFCSFFYFLIIYHNHFSFMPNGAPSAKI